MTRIGRYAQQHSKLSKSSTSHPAPLNPQPYPNNIPTPHPPRQYSNCTQQQSKSWSDTNQVSPPVPYLISGVGRGRLANHKRPPEFPKDHQRYTNSLTTNQYHTNKSGPARPLPPTPFRIPHSCKPEGGVAATLTPKNPTHTTPTPTPPITHPQNGSTPNKPTNPIRVYHAHRIHISHHIMNHPSPAIA